MLETVDADENGDQDNGDALDALRRQHRGFRNQEAEAESRDNDNRHRARIEGLADPEFAWNQLFQHLAHACVRCRGGGLVRCRAPSVFPE